VSVDVVYTVTCDGPHPNFVDFPGEACEAEFDHIALQATGDLPGLERQLRQRGWRSVDGKYICPRHGEGVAP
jgi:hypothetical protein